MFIRDSRRSYRAYSYAGLILITDLFSVGTPVGVTELILCRTYSYTTKFYSCSKVPVGITEITERVLVLRNSFLYGSTTELILVFLSTYW